MVDEVLDNPDGIIDQIIEETDLSKEELMQKIKEKREEYGGLLTEAGAAYSIAKDMGVKKEEVERKIDGESKIKDLSKDQGSVKLEARIKRIYSTKEFEKDGEKSNVTNMEIKDDTGEIRAVLWDKKELVEKMEKNTPIKIENGYAKEGMDGLEVNVGDYGSIEILEESEIPKVEVQENELTDIEPGMDDINIHARIDRIFPMNRFQKGDREGKVTNAFITNGESRKRLVLWGEHAESAKELEENDLIKIEGGYSKERDDGSTEIHLGWKGRLIIDPDTDKEIPEVKNERKSIKEVKEASEGTNSTVKATIVQAYEPTILDICSECGSMVRDGECKEHGAVENPNHVPILNLVLDDGEDVIRSTLYREKAEKMMNTTGEELYQGEKDFSEIKKEILGEEKIFTGRIKHDKDFDRKELTVNSFRSVKPDKEIKRIKKEG